MNFLDRLQHAWNAFSDGGKVKYLNDIGSSYSYNPSRWRSYRGNERSIIYTIFNRIATDVASVDIVHARLDKNGNYESDIQDGLHNCLTVEANIDQTARAFITDVVVSLFDEGVIAIVPIDTTTNPDISSSYDINTMRVGKIVQWYPRHVKVQVYDDRTGIKRERIWPKESVAIIENPFYYIMNEPNSITKRLIRKLNLLDAIDEYNGSGKLDLLIQLPYTIKTKARREEASRRREEIEKQLQGPYGIAYIDGTERVTQLNRPVENNILKHIEYLTTMMYSQLGISQAILDGSADEQTMLNYNNRIVEVIVSAIVDEMKRKFLTKTARSQGQTILFFRDPFKLLPINNIAEIADKLTRNEILTSNEIRPKIGFKPSSDPKADELRNSNISRPEENTINTERKETENQNEV